MEFPSAFLMVYAAVIAAFLGLVMGSFLNCAAWRMTHGEKISHGRSHCPNCGHTLGVLDLVPVFSWIGLKGKCRYCKDKISGFYPLSEIICAVCFVAVTMRFAVSLQTIEFLILVSVLICATFADLYEYIIPDRLIVIGILNRIVFIFLEGGDLLSSFKSALIGAFSISLPVLIIVLIAEKLLKKEAMGGGDIKLFFMLGMYFNWKINLVGLILACFMGILFGVISAKKREDAQIPFGPSIAGGWFLAMLCGDIIVNWYLGLFA